MEPATFGNYGFTPSIQPVFDEGLELELLRDRVVFQAKKVEAVLFLTDRDRPNSLVVPALRELSEAVWTLIEKEAERGR